MVRQARGRVVRERLLDAAETLFHRDGIARTGVDAVLAEAGISTATLYAHFGGKDRLVVADLQRRLDRWRRVWDNAVAAATTPEDRLLAVFDALARFRENQPAMRGCAFLATAVEFPGSDHPALDVVPIDDPSAGAQPGPVRRSARRARGEIAGLHIPHAQGRER